MLIPEEVTAPKLANELVNCVVENEPDRATSRLEKDAEEITKEEETSNRLELSANSFDVKDAEEAKYEDDSANKEEDANKRLPLSNKILALNEAEEAR